jgi:16S rRNA (guanine966-N2)-methyltransferase
MMIRIIGGELKGRRITAPSNLPVRPTTDYAKEGIFNVLNNSVDFEEVKALDLFAGTGNISYELASRGCTDITSVDLDFRCVKFISETAGKFELRQIRTIRSDVYAFLGKAKGQWDLIFADPPFDQKEVTRIPELVFKNNLLLPGGLLVVEHPERILFPDASKLKEQRHYGKVHFSIFRQED